VVGAAVAVPHRICVKPIENKPEATPSPEVCVITVLYDDDPTRQQAMRACDFLVGQFWEQVELEFHWWRTDFLRDTLLAAAAAENAAASDFLILSAGSPARLSLDLQAWIQSWLDRRTGSAGALVDLQVRPRKGGRVSERERFLAEACGRGRFDYLTTGPGEIFGAEKFPAGVGDIWLATPDADANRFRPPTHYGLNE
jgi:hypothetical protein